MDFLRKIFIERSVSLRIVLLVSFFLAAMIPSILIGSASYYIYKSNMIKLQSTSRVDVMDQITERTSAVKRSTEAISNIYFNDNRIYDALHDTGENRDDIYLYLNSLNNNYKKAFENVGIPYYITIAGFNGFKYCSIENHQDEIGDVFTRVWYGEIIKADGDIFWSRSFVDSLYNANEYVFSAARLIKDKSTNDPIGILIVNIPERILFSTYENILNKSNSIYIVDSKGNIISAKDTSMLGLNYFQIDRLNSFFEKNNYNVISKNNEKYFLSMKKDESSGWMVLEEIPLKEIMKPFQPVNRTLISVSVIIAIASYFLAYILAVRTYTPLNLLGDRIEKIRGGSLDVEFDINGWKEIKQLNQVLSNMLARIKKLLMEIKFIETKKREMEINFLLTQMNPHFLYNTLFSMKCLISLGKNEKAEAMLSLFSPILKRILNSKEEFVTLRSEINFLNKYIGIQQYRFDKEFIINCDIPDKYLNKKVPRFILQPIIENSIIHGFSTNTAGYIDIQAFKERKNIIIKIADNGSGFNIDNLKRKDEKNAHIGISNVDQRIKLHYGNAYGIQIASEIDKGTIVTIKLPL